MATARIDALWVHDGLLDARDYKTGQVWSDRVADDKQARLQAWVLAPLAERARAAAAHRVRAPRRRGASTTPSRSSPTPTTCSRSRRSCGARSPRSGPTTEFAGVADADVCRRCRYRSICPDSATPGVPVWPMVDAEDDA